MNLKAQQHRSDIPKFKNIPEILVKPSLGVMRISRDTIEYKVEAQLAPEIVKVEDLFRNYLGFNVTEEGRIFYNGKEVSVLLIDGDPVSLSDYRILSQHLNANMFSSIELIQEYHSNRFEKISFFKQEIAINLILKKEFRNRINADISSKVVSSKGIDGKIGLNRIGGNVKSIAILEKNYYGDRWVSIKNSILGDQQINIPLICIIQHPIAFQSNIFKQTYLFNNVGHRFKILHNFKLASYSKMQVETGVEHVDLTFKESQKTSYHLGEYKPLIEQRNSGLSLSNENRSIKIHIEHDHFKNNKGKYSIYLDRLQLKQQLQDSVEAVTAYINTAWDIQKRNLIVLQGEEKFLVRKYYLLETSIQAASSSLTRLFDNSFSEKNDLSILQKYLATNIGLSFQFDKQSFHIGNRFVAERRELSSRFRKQYMYIEHQYRLNKKLLLNTDLSVGRGEISNLVNRYIKTIYQFQLEGIYKKSMFNQLYLKYFSSQKIPTLDTWVFNPLLQLSGYMQHTEFPDRFSFIRKIELGKSYQHLFRGFGYNYSLVFDDIKNDVSHSFGFRHITLTDTVRYRGAANNFQIHTEADQFIFPFKIRITASYQYTRSHFSQGMMGKSYPMVLRHQSIRVACKSAWEKLFQWELSSSFQQNLSNNEFSKNTIYIFTHQLNSKFKVAQTFYAATQITFLQTQQKSNYIFLDCLIQLKISEKCTINITALNALNIQRFQQRFISNYSVQTITTPLAGRKIQVEIRKSF